MSSLISVSSKGPGCDSSMLTEVRKRRAIINAQFAKNPVDDPTKKPFIGQFHLTDGVSNGIVAFRFSKGLNLYNKSGSGFTRF
jgi:hypothetical protein